MAAARRVARPSAGSATTTGSFDVNATDEDGDGTTQVVTITATVTPQNAAPVITSPDAASA